VCVTGQNQPTPPHRFGDCENAPACVDEPISGASPVHTEDFSIKGMREQSLVADMSDVGFGRIVNMASRAALGKELRTAYSASKESRRSDRRDAAGSRRGDVVERAPLHPRACEDAFFTHRRFSPFVYHM
jgi:hypothetical protein